MLSIFKNIFGGTRTDLSKLLADGAVVVDVRSKDEFASGHAKGALNIPLDKLGTKIQQLKKHPHIIVCCRVEPGAAWRRDSLKGTGSRT